MTGDSSGDDADVEDEDDEYRGDERRNTISDLYALLEDAQDRDRIDGEGGGLCFPRGLGSLDRIESDDPSGASDPSRQVHMAETLRVMRDMRREMSNMQAELLAYQEQQGRARRPRPDARIPDHQDASGDADSHV
ncbi:hypothetical protein Tco_0612369 [Tanacetum coccineum]